MPAVGPKPANAAMRAVAKSGDAARFQFRTSGFRVLGVVVSLRPNVLAPSAAQAAGYGRVLVYSSEEGGTGKNVTVNADGSCSQPSVQGDPVADLHTGLTLGVGQPVVIPITFDPNRADTLTVEVPQAVDNTGAAFDTDVACHLITEGVSPVGALV